MATFRARRLHLSTRSLPCQVDFLGLADRLPGRWVPFWYRHLLPRPVEAVQTQVNVSFRDLDNLDASDSRDAFRTVPVKVTAVGQLRLGSVLVNGRMSEEFELPSRRFSIEFTRDSTKPWISTDLLSSARVPDWFSDPVDSVRAESQNDEDRFRLGGPWSRSSSPRRGCPLDTVSRVLQSLLGQVPGGQARAVDALVAGGAGALLRTRRCVSATAGACGADLRLCASTAAWSSRIL